MAWEDTGARLDNPVPSLLALTPRSDRRSAAGEKDQGLKSPEGGARTKPTHQQCSRLLSQSTSPSQLRCDGSTSVSVLFCHRADGYIWLLERATGIASRLTRNSVAADPIWSPDGGQLVFTVFEGLTGNLYRKVIDGTGEELLFESRENKYASRSRQSGRISFPSRRDNGLLVPVRSFAKGWSLPFSGIAA